MKTVASLKRPYTDKQRFDFIVEYNHNQGYIIDESPIEIKALGYTEEEKQQQELEQRKKDFFETSLGYVKRKVSMQTGETRDFLFDIKPTLQVGIPIITYNLDGTQNLEVLVTEKFLTECDKQIYKDFYGTDI